MSDKFTPDTDEVQDAYISLRALGDDVYAPDYNRDRERAKYRGEFERWLNDQLAEAWDVGFGLAYTGGPGDNPFRQEEEN